MTLDYLGETEKLFPRATAMDALRCVFVHSAERSFVKLYSVTTFSSFSFLFYYRQTPTLGTFKSLQDRRNSSPTGYTQLPSRGTLTQEIEPRPRAHKEKQKSFSSSKIFPIFLKIYFLFKNSCLSYSSHRLPASMFESLKKVHITKMNKCINKQ